MEEVPQATWKERVLLFLGRRTGFRVEGASMSPALNDGDAVLIKRQSTAANGDIVLVRHPYKTNVKIIKRLGGFDENGAMILEGDNPAESTDSRTFGPVPIKCLIGKVTCRLKQ
jgi:nickel-type superoxide dismutase maturation protease